MGISSWLGLIALCQVLSSHGDVAYSYTTHSRCMHYLADLRYMCPDDADCLCRTVLASQRHICLNSPSQRSCGFRVVNGCRCTPMLGKMREAARCVLCVRLHVNVRPFKSEHDVLILSVLSTALPAHARPPQPAHFPHSPVLAFTLSTQSRYPPADQHQALVTCRSWNQYNASTFR